MNRWLLVAVLLAGCKDKTVRQPCAPSQPSQVEIRDASGELQLAVKAGDRPGALDLCDVGNRRVGGLQRDGQTLTLLDGANKLVLKVKSTGPDDFSADGPKGPRLRVHRTPAELRVLTWDGIPFGSVVPADAGATIYNKASAPIGSVGQRDKDLVLRAADGAVTTYLVPSASPAAAGLLGIEGLALEERLALYLLFSQNAR